MLLVVSSQMLGRMVRYPDWIYEFMCIYSLTDMEFVQKFTQPDFRAKNFTPSISPNFDSFSKKKHKQMSENGEIYTAGKSFTLPPPLTNSTSAVQTPIYWQNVLFVGNSFGCLSLLCLTFQLTNMPRLKIENESWNKCAFTGLVPPALNYLYCSYCLYCLPNFHYLHFLYCLCYMNNLQYWILVNQILRREATLFPGEYTCAIAH